MRAAWVVVALAGLAGCATGKQAKQEEYLGLAGCSPCYVPCYLPCAPAAAATFSPAPGTFTSKQMVTLSTTTPDAVIRYTTDGTDPTEKSPVYKGAIPVTETTMIKAMARVPGAGHPRSEIASGMFAMAPPPAPPAAAPAEPASPPVPPPVAVTPERLELNEKILFETGRAEIDASSTSLLDAVAGALQDHPEVGRVVIEGHTDAQGGDAVNERLSKDRADAVRGYLIEKGVEPGRLEAQGFGSRQPVADNATPEGREANRRVAFVVAAPARERETGTGSSAGDTGAADTDEKESGSNAPPR
jgi:outer membrane protein OmpA-like peptidoglycan-associated protein